MALRDVPGYGIYMVVYEKLCRTLEEHGLKQGVIVSGASGGTAGVISWFLSMPYDVIKSKVQANVLKTDRKSNWCVDFFVYKKCSY